MEIMPLFRSKKQRIFQHEDDQGSCALLALPPEVREQIWSYVLHTAINNPLRPHFHIYDKVYDSCTYDAAHASCGARKRERSNDIALIKTCRKIYQETVQSLYNERHFELVVYAGLARPSMLGARETNSGIPVNHNLGSRTCLGKLEKCSQLSRIRNATIVLQPGAYPKVEQYRERVATLLEVMDHGKEAKCLILCVCLRKHISARLTDDLVKIFEALHPLNSTVGPGKLICLSVACTASATIGNLATTELMQVLDKARLQSDANVKKYIEGTECFERGVFGKEYHPPPKAAMHGAEERVYLKDFVLRGFAVALLLVVATGVLVEYLCRKKIKGERFAVV